MRILLVEDEEIQRISIRDDLRDSGYEVTAVDSPKPAIKLLIKETFPVVLSDLRMPGMDGLEFLKKIKQITPESEVIIMTAYATVKTAVEAIRIGAYDYITKPFEIDELLKILFHIGKMQMLTEENIKLHQQLEKRASFGNIIGKSSVMQKVYKQLEAVAPTDSAVLITGETGTGKEIIADSIHYNSKRAEKPMIKVSCAILSREILESELFGHEKGAFTGATQEKKGRFELAHGGTIFLDDVDDIPIDLQVKLLRVLQEMEVERVGGAKPKPIDVRVIVSTKQDLRELVQEEKFRADLFYRFNVFPVHLPALVERKEDIPLLLDHFLRKYFPNSKLEIDEKTISILMDYAWEGNVRELKNLAERLSVICKCNPIVPECLPIEMLEGHQRFYFTPKKMDEGFSLTNSVGQFENGMLSEALEKCDGNREKAAKMLGIPVSTLKSKLKKYGIALKKKN